MSKKEKLLKRLLSKPKDFEWNEAVSLLECYEIYQAKTGKTGGSRARFSNADKSIVITIHKPHNPNGKDVLKPYALDIIIDQLKQGGLL